MHIHLSDFIDDNVRMILPPSADGAAPIVYTYTVAGLGAPTGMAFDGTHIHLVDTIDANIRMILPPSGSGAAPIIYTYTVAGLNQPTGMAFDGTHIHLSDSSDDNVRMILPPSGNGAAPIIYTYTVTGLGNSTGMAFDGTHIHLSDNLDQNIRMILPPSGNGEAPIVYTYTVAGLGDPQSMAFDGTHIHLADNTDQNIRMILPPSSNGAAPIVYTYTVAGLGVPAGMAFDGATTTQAVLTISTTDTDIRAGETVDINIEFSASVTGVTASDFTVSGGTRGALSGSGTNYTLSVTAGSAGTMTVSIAEDAVSPGNAAASQDFTVNALPTVAITFSETEAEVGTDFTATFQWSESVSGFATGDITLSSGTKGTFTSVDGDTYTLVISPPSSGSGTITVSVAASAVTLGNAATSDTIDYAEGFSAAWHDIPTDTVSNDFSVELHFSEAVTGLAISDFRLRRTGGTDSNSTFFTPTDSDLTITAISGTNNYRLDFTLTGTYAGTYYIRLINNSVTADGNTQPASNLHSIDITIDSSYTDDATVAISTDDTDIRAGETVDINIEFSASVTGVTASDFTVSGGTRGTLSGSGTDYTLSVTAGSAGTMTVSIAEDAVSPGNAAASHDFTVNALPTVTITASDSDIRVGEEFTTTFQWSESISGFATGDVTVTGATKGTFTSTDGDTYTLVLTADSSAGNIIVTVAASAVTLGNTETSQTFTSSALPTVDITSSVSPIIAGTNFTLTFQWSESVTGFTAADITLSTGTKGTFTSVDGDTYTLVVSPPNSGSGTIEVTVREDAVGLDNAAYSESFTYDELVSATISSDNTIYAGLTYDIDIDFTESVTGFTAGDITVSGATKGALSGSGASYTLSVTAGSGAGTITIAIAADRVSPENAAISQDLTRNALPTVTISTDDDDIRVSETFDVDIVFSTSVTGFTAGDVTVTGGTRGTLTGSGTDYTLNVTASSTAGTLTVSIDENVVLPANESVSENFTKNALPTVDITVNNSDIHEDDVFTATFQWSESVTNFATSDVSVSGGSKGTFSSTDGDTYTLSITAGSGAGTITISVAASAIDEGNTAYSENFTRNANTAPNAPTSLSVSVSSTSATLSWTAPSDDGGTAITEYQVSSDDGSTWSDTNSTSTSYTITGLITDIEYTFRVRAVNSVGNSTASSSVVRTTTASTTLAIEDIDEQSIQVGTTDYELEIYITNGGADTEIDIQGLQEGFYYDWDEVDTLTIKVDEATRIIADAVWAITVTEGSETVTSTIIYNVVSIAPVIATVDTLALTRGVDFSEEVSISNEPSSVLVESALASLKFEAGGEGVIMNGNLPSENANLTITEFDGTITASNDGGEHTRAVLFNIRNVVFYGGRVISGNDEIVVFLPVNDGEDIADIRIFTIDTTGPADATVIALDDDYFYTLYPQTNTHVWRHNKNTLNGQTSDGVSVFAPGFQATALAVDENYFYIIATTEDIYVYNKSGVLQHNVSTPSTLSNVRAATIDGNNLILHDIADDALYWFDKTVSSGMSSIQKTVHLPFSSLFIYGIDIFDDKIAILDSANHNIRLIDKNTADGETAEVVETWNVPSAYRPLRGLAVEISN